MGGYDIRERHNDVLAPDDTSAREKLSEVAALTIGEVMLRLKVSPQKSTGGFGVQLLAFVLGL